MGFNTALMICNDGIDQIRKNADDFVAGIEENMSRGGSFGVGNHGGIVTVAQTQHADCIQIVGVGGNSLSNLHDAWYGLGSDLTADSLLRRWADAAGYRLVRKGRR